MKKYGCLIMMLAAMVSSLNAKPLVDPTRPKNTLSQSKTEQKNSQPQFVLTAVFINTKGQYAIINGQNYKTGQEVQGNELISISQNQVVLDTRDGKKTLFLNNHTIKKDINNGF